MITKTDRINSYEYNNIITIPIACTAVPFLIGFVPIACESATFLWFAFLMFLLSCFVSVIGFIVGCFMLAETGYGSKMLVDRIPRSEAITYIVCCTIFPLFWIGMLAKGVKNLLVPLTHIFKTLTEEEK